MASSQSAGVPIADIRRDKSDHSFLETLRVSLNPREGQTPEFPTVLLYDGTEVLDA
jgi:hypothetical protein